MKEEQNPYRAHLYRRKKTNENKTPKWHKVAHVVAYLTLLTGPLRIQLWSQDKRGYIKINRERTRSEKTKQKKTNREEIRRKEAGVKVACKGHHRQEGIQEVKTKKQNRNKPGQPHIIRVGQERQPYKQCKKARHARLPRSIIQ